MAYTSEEKYAIVYRYISEGLSMYAIEKLYSVKSKAFNRWLDLFEEGAKKGLEAKNDYKVKSADAKINSAKKKLDEIKGIIHDLSIN